MATQEEVNKELAHMKEVAKYLAEKGFYIDDIHNLFTSHYANNWKFSWSGNAEISWLSVEFSDFNFCTEKICIIAKPVITV